MIHVFKNYDALTETAASFIYEVGKRKVTEQSTFYLVLSGGKTPEAIYSRLASISVIDRAMWFGTQVFWGDERCVPPENPLSNYRMASEALLKKVPIDPLKIHRIPAEQTDLTEAIKHYEDKYPISPDLVLLGMGEDGHTASLFPDSHALNIKDRNFVLVETDAEPRHRVTMTPKAIECAEYILVIVSGKEKATALKQVFESEGYIKKTPARLMRKRTWYVDQDAARLLFDLDYLADEIIVRK